MATKKTAPVKKAAPAKKAPAKPAAKPAATKITTEQHRANVQANKQKAKEALAAERAAKKAEKQTTPHDTKKMSESVKNAHEAVSEAHRNFLSALDRKAEYLTKVTGVEVKRVNERVGSTNELTDINKQIKAARAALAALVQKKKNLGSPEYDAIVREISRTRKIRNEARAAKKAALAAEAA